MNFIKYSFNSKRVKLKLTENVTAICKRLYNSYKMNSPYFVTTPIFYVNASPHIGHLYSALLADASFRFHRLQHADGQDGDSHSSIFSTGTDEHGTKIQQSAAAANMSLPDFCRAVSNEYREMFKLYDVNYTTFIRTSSEKHKNVVQHFWKELESRGHIYIDKYEGWYCVADETFLTDKQLTVKKLADGTEQKVSAESGRPVEWTQEENYKFRLSNFQDDLLHWLEDENVVKPKKFHGILLNWVKEGAMVDDISISRPAQRVHWGVTVPGNENQTVYVWLDALINYLTVAGYPDHQSTMFWPPSVQVVGKDILKFHGIYWPAFLIAAGLKPPTSLLVHSHWTVEGEKMSKSAGNVVDPMDRAEIYTPSGLRYNLLKEGTPQSDGNYSDITALRCMNADLADTLGNLLSRCTGKVVNAEQTFPAFVKEDYETYCKEHTTSLRNRLTTLADDVAKFNEDFRFYRGAELIMSTLHDANKFFDVTKPWELRKSHEDEAKHHLDCVLSITMETLRICAIGLLPIIPKLATEVLDKLNINADERMWKHMSVSFFTADDESLSDEIISKPPWSISSENIIIYKKIVHKKT